MPQIGCSPLLERKAAGLALAAKDVAARLKKGETAFPKPWVIDGVAFSVTALTSLVADGSTDQRSAVQAALNAASANTLVVIPPNAQFCAIGGKLDVPGGVYLCGYGAAFMFTGAQNRITITGDNAGVLGLRARTSNVSGWSKWMKIWATRTDNALYPAKESVLTNSNEWLYCSGRSNVIFKDCSVRGGRGGVRLYFSSEVLIEGCKVADTESDGIHVTKASKQVTVRGCAVTRAGDDMISVVGYNRLEPGNGTPPSGILIEGNTCSWGRARGLSVHGGEYVVHRDNHVAHILRAGIYYSAEKYNDLPGHHARNLVAERNILENCGLLSRSDPADGWVAALAYGAGQSYLGSATYPAGETGPQIVDGIALTDTVFIRYTDERYDPTTNAFRASPGANSGVVAPIVSGSSVVNWA